MDGLGWAKSEGRSRRRDGAKEARRRREGGAKKARRRREGGAKEARREEAPCRFEWFALFPILLLRVPLRAIAPSRSPSRRCRERERDRLAYAALHDAEDRLRDDVRR